MIAKKCTYSIYTIIIFITVLLSGKVFYAQKLTSDHFKKIDSVKKLTLKEVNEEYVFNSYFELSQLFKKSNMDSSYFYTNKSIDLALKYGNLKQLCISYRTLGELYYLHGKYDIALDNFKKAMGIIEKTKDSSYYPYLKLNISDVRAIQGNLDIALEELKAAQQYAIYRDDHYINGTIYLKSTTYFLKIGLLKEARFYLDKGLELSKKTNMSSLESWFHFNEGKYLKIEKKYDEAIDLLKKNLNNNKFIGADFIDFRITCLNTISECFYLKKDYINALKYVFKANNLFTNENTIFNRKQAYTFNSIGRIYIKLADFDNAERYLKKSLHLATKNKISSLKIDNYKDLYSLYKTTNDNKNALHYLEQNLFLMQKEENSALSDLIVSIKTSEKLKNQKLNFKEQEDKLKKQMNLTKSERNLVIIIFIIFVFLIILLYLHNLAKNEKQISSFRLRALRTQMNPHFIFNTLNAIQSYVINEDKITAYKQLTRFSKSIRFILDESEQDFITLKKEIEFIKDYVALEQMRFGKRLTFFLEIKTDAELDTFLIPTLMLQPIIENSIIHGISNKDEGGYVKLKIDKEEDKLRLIVEDNGIGRVKAREIQKQFPFNKRSISSINISKRLNLLKKNYAGDVNIQIYDRKDDKGTVVIIEFPILSRYKYAQ